MKTVIFGANGMLGHAARSVFEAKGHQVVPVSRREYNIAEGPVSELETLLEGADAVLNCAGVIKPRIAETPIEHTLRVNSIFPQNLAKLCQKHSIPCIHITTDCVYSGASGHYDENSLFDADDVYGMSKNAGEGAQCMVIRTSIVGEEEGKGRSLLAWAQSQAGRDVKGFLNHHWNGVTTVYLSEICEKIFSSGSREKGGLFEQGLFHVYSPSPVNKYELVSLMSEVYELGLRVEPVNAPVACDRTLASIHPLSRVVCTKELGVQLVDMRGFFRTVRRS